VVLLRFKTSRKNLQSNSCYEYAERRFHPSLL